AEFAAKECLGAKVVTGAQIRPVDVNMSAAVYAGIDRTRDRDRRRVESRRVEVRAMQNLDVLSESQGQPAQNILAFQTNEMLDHIVVRMIDINENTRRIIQPNVIVMPPHNLAEADRDGRLDCDIPIGDTIEMRQQNIIVVNAANRQTHTPLKTLRRRGNGGTGAINPDRKSVV